MRDGVYSVAQLMDIGKQMLGRRHVMSSVIHTLHEVQIEGTFPDGTYLVTVHDPICTDNGNLEIALYGSFLPIPSDDKFPVPEPLDSKAAPGAMIIKPGKIELNAGRRKLAISVTNYGDRPIQVLLKTQSFLFFLQSKIECIESNRRLDLTFTLLKPIQHCILIELLLME